MNLNKAFIITIDTEADNQWDYDAPIKTENIKFLPRFQELSEKYGFKPVWLTNYEMAEDPHFVEYMREKQDKGLCEIGMHLHAWNTPPESPINRSVRERDYLIEYPVDIMEKKIATMTETLEKNFGRAPVSHRSGRWTTNEDYFRLLHKFGYKVDCSVTPHIDWSHKPGSTGKMGNDYSQCPQKPYYIFEDILEVPMTIRPMRTFTCEPSFAKPSVGREIKKFFLGRKQWLRPDCHLQKKPLFKLIDRVSHENQYLMFMLHSSEMMPGGSPSFKDEASIEKLYEVIEAVFARAHSLGYTGTTLREFAEAYSK